MLVVRQLSRTAPLLPVDLLRIPLFALSVASSVCSFIAQSIGQVSMPFLFQHRFGLDQVMTGLLMTPWPLVVAVIAPFAGRLADKYPAGLLGGCGMAVMGLGLLAMSLLPDHPTTLDIAWRMTVCGLGFGFFNTPNNRAIITSAPPIRTGGRERDAGDGAVAGAVDGGGAGGAGLHRVPGERADGGAVHCRGGGRGGGVRQLQPAGGLGGRGMMGSG